MLKFIPLGGIGEVTKNMFVYETDRDILIVDCGAGFPEEETEDRLLIPDFSYLHSINKKKNIRGVVVSHAHFDHYGALPYFLSEFDVPVFSSLLALEFLREKIKEIGLNKSINLHPLRGKERLFLGDFKVTPFFVNHSVPDTFGFHLQTPSGEIFHVSDYKFDLTPVDGKVFDFKSCVYLAKSGALGLASDCLGACEKGFTQTEKGIEDALYRLMSKTKGQIFVTTLSSNIFRIKQIISSARRLDRKVVVLGRSLETSLKIGTKLRYLKRKGWVERKGKIDESKTVYLVAGSYGQSNSTLMRIAQGKYPQVSLQRGAIVIFSADPSPPNTKDRVDKLVDLLTVKGARVHYYEIQENLHTSGHGSADDIKLLIALVKPKFLIPIGGCPRHMRAYSLLASEMGVNKKKVFELSAGQTLLFAQGKAHLGPQIKLKERKILV